MQRSEDAVIALSLVLGCGGAGPEPEVELPPTLPRVYSMSFESMPITDDLLSAKLPTSATKVVIDKKPYDLVFRTIYKRGDDGFGDLVAQDGSAVDHTCNNQDFNALFESQGHAFLVSHFECTPGAMYLTRLKADAAGLLTPEFNKRVDFSKLGGVWNPCAGMVTPWGTHLASEEYEPDASYVPVSEKEHGWDYRAWAGMERYLPDGEKLQPYLYGWTPEVTVTSPDGGSTVVKHKAPGRFSHEIAYVLPDERTVYLSDDGHAVGWFMFVADVPKDLSGGVLYAAKFKQTYAERGGGGTVEWINLGHTDDATIDGLIAGGVEFSDLFEKQAPDAAGQCAEGFRFVHADRTKECLRLKPPSDKVPNPALAASRLETRRYAGFMGATTEFQKGEGVTFDPESGTVYVAFSKIKGRMADEGREDDHIRLPKNNCGAIWAGSTQRAVQDSDGRLIESAHVMVTLESLVAGREIEPDARGNTCFQEGIANPDNITFLPKYNILMVGEDTSAHVVASLWAIEMATTAMRRVLTAPPHGEITGIHWVKNLQGHGYLTVAVQHPWKAETLAGTTLPDGITAADQRSITGYLGPFPPLD